MDLKHPVYEREEDEDYDPDKPAVMSIQHLIICARIKKPVYLEKMIKDFRNILRILSIYWRRKDICYIL